MNAKQWDAIGRVLKTQMEEFALTTKLITPLAPAYRTPLTARITYRVIAIADRLKIWYRRNF